MPKAPRSEKEIKAIREDILDVALELIIDGGFDNLSMRKVASKMSVAVTTIYAYVASKDELNLLIRIKGFEILYGKLEKNYNSSNSFEQKISGMIKSYAEFGISYHNYYDLMFNLATPKYTDYIGTDIEETALMEKQNALKSLTIFKSLVKEYTVINKIDIAEDFINYTMIKIWSDLHGIITLYNSRVLYEVDENSKKLFDRRVEDIVNSTINLKDIFSKSNTTN